MIKVTILGTADNPCGFEVAGHSGYSGAGSDIVCSAVSAMSQLVINTITEVYKDKAQVSAKYDDNMPQLSCRLDEPYSLASQGLIRGFYIQLREFAMEYPKYLKVITISERKVTQ